MTGSLRRDPLRKAVVHSNAIETPGARPAHCVTDWRIAPARLQATVVAQ
ncbi:MAG: hypothetical protein LBJ65_32805 [Burkholderia sp.]|jgi:cellulose synthase (UDP-forming)|nr:hypothetical protein [Burkholderia sp.]MDR0246400.1 hypothetical protein [Burkholderia sp.]